MYLDPAKKQEIFGKYGKSNTDTGSPEAQIALFSYRISHLTEHLKLHRKDFIPYFSSDRALEAPQKRLYYGKVSDQTGGQAPCIAQLPEGSRHREIPRYREGSWSAQVTSCGTN